MSRWQLRSQDNGKIQVNERWRYPASTQTAATASLGFRNDDFALSCSLLGNASGISIGGVDLRKVMEFLSETSGCQAVSDSLELERPPLHPRQLLSIVHLNAHSS